MVELLQYIAGVLMLVGAVFAFLAAVGILRLPDVYTRMHAASKAGTLGSGLMLGAIAFAAFDGAVILRAICGFAFLLLTAPVSSHLLARSSILAGIKPIAGTDTLDLDENENS